MHTRARTHKRTHAQTHTHTHTYIHTYLTRAGNGAAGVSGTVIISDQRSYNNIETLRGKNPTEIHSALSEVCGKFTVDRSNYGFSLG